MEAVEPEKRGGPEELPHFGPAVVEDERVPVGMPAQARVLVLVERGPVEAGQAVRVGREVGGGPVQDDSEPGTVAPVDEPREVGGRSQAAGGSEVAQGLVTPGTVERVLHHGQQLEMGEAETFGVSDQIVAEIVPPGEDPAVRGASPRLGVQFIDGHGGFDDAPPGAGAHPGFVAPGPVSLRFDHGCGRRPELVSERHRIGLLEKLALPRPDRELVEVSAADARDEQLPDAGGASQAHGMPPSVPAVEAAHDAHRRRVGSPDGEEHALDAAAAPRSGAEHVVKAEVRALAEEEEIEISELGQEAVGIFADQARPIAQDRAEPVSEGGACAPGSPDEEPVGVDPVHGARPAAVLGQYGDGFGAGQECTDLEPGGPLRPERVQPEEDERIGKARADDGSDLRGREYGSSRRLSHTRLRGLAAKVRPPTIGDTCQIRISLVLPAVLSTSGDCWMRKRAEGSSARWIIPERRQAWGAAAC